MKRSVAKHVTPKWQKAKCDTRQGDKKITDIKLIVVRITLHKITRTKQAL